MVDESHTADASADEHDAATPGGPSRARRWGRLAIMLAAVAAVAAVLAAVVGTSWLQTVGAVLVGVLILRVGWFFLQQFATPPPPPPDRGTLRRVRLTYRCNVCGAEVRMTVANDEDPEPPRHCMDDMQLITPLE